MGWRASTLYDLVVVVLVRHGPHTIRELGERMSRAPYHAEWMLIYGDWPDHYYGRDDDGEWGHIKGRPAPVGYTDLYQRLKKLEKHERVVNCGRAKEPGRSSAMVWRAVTREEKLAELLDRTARLVVPRELREQAADAAAKIECTVGFEVVNERGYVRMKTPRGPVVVSGPPEQSWWDAAIELGLAG